MTTLADLRSLVRDFQTQHDLDQRLLAIYRLGVEDGAEAALIDGADVVGWWEDEEQTVSARWLDEIVGRVR